MQSSTECPFHHLSAVPPSSLYFVSVQLRSSFNKAFSIKKGSKTYSDIEEITTPDSSAPNSPKMLHEGAEEGESQPSSLKMSTTSSA